MTPPLFNCHKWQWTNHSFPLLNSWLLHWLVSLFVILVRDSSFSSIFSSSFVTLDGQPSFHLLLLAWHCVCQVQRCDALNAAMKSPLSLSPYIYHTHMSAKWPRFFSSHFHLPLSITWRTNLDSLIFFSSSLKINLISPSLAEGWCIHQEDP